MKKNKRCIICNNKKIAPVGSFIQGEIRFSIARCAKCDLYFQDPMPTKRDLRQLYEEIYNNKHNLPCAKSAFEKKDKGQERGRILELERFKKGGRIMDFGASSGFFLSELSDNWEKYGIEYSRKAVEKAKKDFNISLLHGGIEKFKKFPDNFFDVIIMNSVFEHLENPKLALNVVHKKLKNNGFFVFNVPNMRSLEHRLYKMLKKPFPGFIFEHTFYYNAKNITKLLMLNSFTVEQITSRHYSTLHLPSKRPLIGWLTFIIKLFLEYTSMGGSLRLGNIIYIYAKKNN